MTWTNKYIRYRFTEKSTGPDNGNCWDLLVKIYREEMGKTIPDYHELYETRTDENIPEIVETVKEDGWREVFEPQPFDVILLRTDDPAHVGIVVDPAAGTFIHCMRGCNCVIDSFKGLKWKFAVEGFFRYER